MADNDIDPLAHFAYQEGVPPLEWAVQIMTFMIEMHADVVEARRTDPAAFPILPPDFDAANAARRAIGTLLDAGWTPPPAPA